jgi:hypothetical protein
MYTESWKVFINTIFSMVLRRQCNTLKRECGIASSNPIIMAERSVLKASTNWAKKQGPGNITVQMAPCHIPKIIRTIS